MYKLSLGDYYCEAYSKYIYIIDYLYIHIIYLVCHECCIACNGRSNTDCVGGCAKENSCYPIHNTRTTCLHRCHNMTSPHYLDTSIEGEEVCRECHTNCQVCDGPSSDNCFQCKPPFMLTNERECIYMDCKNFPDTFQAHGKCVNCSYKCDGCEYSPDYCLACHSPYLFLPSTHTCFALCPPQLYENSILRECQGTYIYIYIYSLSRELPILSYNKSSRSSK